MKKKEEPLKSQTIDMISQFKPVPWANSTTIYEVNVRQYTTEGTLNAFATHLPRLKKLGVETLWFMPLTPIAQKNKKGTLGSYYACSDYTAVSPEFGTIEDFKKLVKQAHEMGFKVIIDWVANHTGWDHRWTDEHPEFYLKDSATNDFQIASGMDDIIELDFSNAALRKAMKEAMLFWVRECDIDGFRCDLAFWVELDFWQEARKEIDAVKKLFWLGEFDELEKPEYGEVFDASYSWTWMHQTKEFYQGHLKLDSLLLIVKKYDDLGDSTMRAWFTTNHDENSWNGTEFEKYGEMAKTLAVFSATWNGIPLIYSGQEAGNKKRLEFFEKDPINWSDTAGMSSFYQQLFHLKRNNPALRAGDPSVITYRLQNSLPEQVFGYLRVRDIDNSQVMVILNMSPTAATVSLSNSHVNGNYRDIFTGEMLNAGMIKAISLKPWQYIVAEKE